MKKIIALALLVISFTSFAQEKNKRENRLSPEQQTELQIKKMTLDLDLNVAQQNQLKPILLENNKQKEERFKQMQSRQQNKNHLTAEERYKIKDKILDNQIELKNKMKSILNQTQFEKWESMKQQSHKKLRKKVNERKNN